MTEREDDRGEGREPLDEETAWAQIVAAYGEEPADPPDPRTGDGRGERDDDRGDRTEPDGDAPVRPPSAARTDGDGGDDGGEGGDGGGEPVRSFTVYAAGTGPRDWRPADPSDDDVDGDDEGHFVPPEPPPLPRADTTVRFAWLAALGGPLLLVLTVLFQQDMTWWITTLGVGGFLGGFATLVSRLRDGREDDDFDDPGRGAVV